MIKVDSEKIVQNVRHHDLLLGMMLFDGDIIKISLVSNSGENTEIVFEGVKFFQSKELIPKGIVLSFYYSAINELPDYPASELDFEKLESYGVEGEEKIAIFDGTMGFEMAIVHENITFSSN